jgi:hypothetical protein
VGNEPTEACRAVCWEIAPHDQRSCASGLGGNMVCLTNTWVQLPRKLFDVDRRGIGHCWLKAAKPPWEWGHIPQKTDIVGRVYVIE